MFPWREPDTLCYHQVRAFEGSFWLLSRSQDDKIGSKMDLPPSAFVETRGLSLFSFPPMLLLLLLLSPESHPLLPSAHHLDNTWALVEAAECSKQEGLRRCFRSLLSHLHQGMSPRALQQSHSMFKAKRSIVFSFVVPRSKQSGRWSGGGKGEDARSPIPHAAHCWAGGRAVVGSRRGFIIAAGAETLLLLQCSSSLLPKSQSSLSTSRSLSRHHQSSFAFSDSNRPLCVSIIPASSHAFFCRLSHLIPHSKREGHHASQMIMAHRMCVRGRCVSVHGDD